MQSIAAVSWFPITALIFGLIFGVLTLGSACLMILKEQRPSGTSVTLAVLGAILLMVCIWQSRGGNIREMQAKIAELEQQTAQLAKQLEEASGQQANRTTTLSDADAQMLTSLSSLQKASTQRGEQINMLNGTQTQISDSITTIKQNTDQNTNQIQVLSDKHEQASVDLHNQLKNQQTMATEHERLINYAITQLEKLQTDTTAMASAQSKQFENLEKQRRILERKVDGVTKQHQAAFTSLREDVEAASAQGQVLNFVKVSTQRELSNLRREVTRLQEHVQRLQGRRHNVQ